MVYNVKTAIEMQKRLHEAGQKVVLVNFFATWCVQCKSMEPILGEIERKYGESLIIMKINVDKLTDMAIDHKVSCLPTFVFYKNGRKIRDSIAGADEEKLKQKLAKLM